MTIKSKLRTGFPRTYRFLQVIYGYFHHIVQKVRIARRVRRMYHGTNLVVDILGPIVRRGPFRGMTFPLDVALKENAGSKILGSYECELYPYLEEVLSRPIARVVNIGAAEGYFAVGIARRLPNVVVYAFECREPIRQLLEKTARANGVIDRIKIHSACNHQNLAEVLEDSSFVFCDCDGCEAELIDPEKVPALRLSTLLVELHDFIVPGVTVELRRRLEPTHEIALIDQQPRRASEFADLETIPQSYREAVLFEFRPEQQWMLATPKQQPSQS